MTSEALRGLLTRYLESKQRDLSVLADDVVFTTMRSGEEHHGPAAVGRMLQHLYREAFDARAELRALICDGNRAVVEGLFVGRHVGEFAGVAPTGRSVRVPLCVVYEEDGGRIRRGRVYFETAVLLQQLGVPALTNSGTI